MECSKWYQVCYAEICKIMFQTNGCKTLSFKYYQILLKGEWLIGISLWQSNWDLCDKSDTYKDKLIEIRNLKQFEIVSATWKSAKKCFWRKKELITR